MPHNTRLDLREPAHTEQLFQPGRFAQRKSASDGFGQAGHIPCQYDVDLVIIGALWDRIHRYCRPPARTKHPTKLREAPYRLGEEHQPEIADHRVESLV